MLEEKTMLGISIHINGQAIYARTAVNRGKTDGIGRTCYEVDTGDTIWHDPADGAVELARKLLDTIKEQRKVER